VDNSKIKAYFRENMTVKIRQQIKVIMDKAQKWWYGEIPKDIPFIGFVYSDSSILAHKILDYFKKKHEFIIGTILAVLGIIIAIIL
jgi:hypothetical protein